MVPDCQWVTPSYATYQACAMPSVKVLEGFLPTTIRWGLPSMTMIVQFTILLHQVKVPMQYVQFLLLASIGVLMWWWQYRRHLQKQPKQQFCRHDNSYDCGAEPTSYGKSILGCYNRITFWIMLFNFERLSPLRGPPLGFDFQCRSLL
jgi:hypothetical protein